MNGLKLVFENDYARLDLGAKVSGRDAQVQNILVNISTDSDAPVFSGRGTDLLSGFARTGFVSRSYAQHAANFAALDTLFFCKTFNTEKSDIQNVILTAPVTGSGDLTFALEVVFNNATISTNTLSI